MNDLPTRPRFYYHGVLNAPILKTKYGLIHADLETLYSFFQFACTGKMKSVETDRGRAFFVDYAEFAESIDFTARQLQDSFSRLTGGTSGKLCPLFRVRLFQGRYGSRTFYGFNGATAPDIFSPTVLQSASMEKIMAVTKLLEGGPAPNQPAARIIKPIISDTFHALLSLQIRGGETEYIFSNRLPEKNGGKYTKALLTAAEIMYQLHEGTFLGRSPLSEEFQERNRHYITDEARAAIEAAKGDMSRVSELLVRAARRYRKWFWAENEPENKDWLPRELSAWMYNRYNQTSIFLACCAKDPDPVREVVADRIFDALPEWITDAAGELLRPGVDAVSFWAKIKTVLDWYEERAQLLIAIDSNTRYWLDGGARRWFDRYKVFLKSLTKNYATLYLSHLGTGNRTWTAFCGNAAAEYSLTVDVNGDIEWLRKKAKKTG